MTIHLVRGASRYKPAEVPDNELPRVTTILCLRGTDPSLRESLVQLVNQDYPDFEVHLVIDHPDDPSVNVVESIRDELNPANLRVTFLEERRETCSLKCSALVQSINQLDESVEVVALMDADTRPHATWLRELAAPIDPTWGSCVDRQPLVSAARRLLGFASSICMEFWCRDPDALLPCSVGWILGDSHGLSTQGGLTF